MDADRPVTTRANDRLGFAPVADRLASVIADQSAKDGLVFGVEGEWGSGKSTLIHLAKEALRNLQAGPEVVDFAPWLVGERDTLLPTLFDELAAAAANIDPVDESLAELGEQPPKWRQWINRVRKDELWKLKQRKLIRKKIGAQLEAFGAVAGVVGKTAKTLGSAGVPGADSVSRAIEGSAGLFAGGAPIAKRKRALISALGKLSRRIVVFVDDLDRLEPREAAEVLRLIRAVADFPNVIYVLSYDPKVLAETLKKAVQVDNGSAFLEKIVQASFRVPRPQAFDLRQWFRTEVETLFVAILDRIDRRRLAQVVDFQGGRYLETPRDVVRALNALRLHALPVRDLIDIPDMVWLQLVRIGKPELYDWTEEYLTNVAALAGGAAIADESAQAGDARLTQCLAGDGVDMVRARIDLSLVLPGTSSPHFGPERERRPIYSNLSRDVLNPFILGRRLGSPQHYRYYFAFVEPAGALTDAALHAFLAAAANDQAGAEAQFAALADQSRTQGGTMAEVLVDRLIAAGATLPQNALPGIIQALTHSMDSLALSRLEDDFGSARSWPAAEYLVGKLFRSAAPDVRANCIQKLFTEGASLGWITSILRSETFAHGRYGDRPAPPDEWLLSAPEFDEVLATMVRRYRDTAPATLLAVPNLVSLLYGWKQAANNDHAREWVTEQTRTDQGLIEFLSRARGWRSINSQTVYPLQRRDLENFLDYDTAVARLRAIAANLDASETDRQLAAELLDAVAQDAAARW